MLKLLKSDYNFVKHDSDEQACLHAFVRSLTSCCECSLKGT